jgi:sulfur carrier protein
MTEPVAITVDGQVRTVPPGCTLDDLVEQLGRPRNDIATALNGDFVARHLRHAHLLREGDSVTCIQLIVGG